MTEKIEFSQALKESREAANLTQEQLAAKIGRTQQAIQAWEDGRNKPTRRSLFPLIQVLPALGQYDLQSMGIKVVEDPALGPWGGPSTAMQRTVDRFGEQIRQVQERAQSDTPLKRPPWAIASPGIGAQIEKEIFENLPVELQRFMGNDRVADFVSDRLVVEIVAMQSVGVMWESKLLRISTLRLKNKDERFYCMLFVRVSTDSRADEPNAILVRQRALTRLGEMASYHNVGIISADSPIEAAGIIVALEQDMKMDNRRILNDDGIESAF